MKLLAAAMELLRFSTGTLSLTMTLLIILSAIEPAKSLSAWSQIKNANEQIAVSASASNLNKRATKKSISASLFIEQVSLLSAQPFFSSQDWAFLAEETGLEEARIFSSRLAGGKKSREFCTWCFGY